MTLNMHLQLPAPKNILGPTIEIRQGIGLVIFIGVFKKYYK